MNAKLRFAVYDIDKLHGRPKKYQKEHPRKVKREVGNHTLPFVTRQPSKNPRKVSKIYVY